MALKKLKTIKLDLSHGQIPADSPFIRPIGLNPLKFPWPLKDGSVEEAQSAFLFNRIPGNQRMQFMEELWRVLIPEGKATFIVPYWSSARSIQDPESSWPPLCEQSFLYFNKKFRQDNGINNGWKSDFDFVYGHVLDPETQNRPDEVRSFWIKHYLGTANDLQLVLTKKP